MRKNVLKSFFLAFAISVYVCICSYVYMSRQAYSFSRPLIANDIGQWHWPSNHMTSQRPLIGQHPSLPGSRGVSCFEKMFCCKLIWRLQGRRKIVSATFCISWEILFLPHPEFFLKQNQEKTLCQKKIILTFISFLKVIIKIWIFKILEFWSKQRYIETM